MRSAVKLILALALVLVGSTAGAQTDRREVRQGNRKFRKGDFAASEIDYRKAVLKDSASVAANYNLASALYRQEQYEDAAEALGRADQQAAETPHAASYYYNEGDVALQRKDYSAAVKAFRQSLLQNPGDLEAKENYIYAKLMLQNRQNGGGGQNQPQQDQQDRQDQQNQDQQDQNKDQNQDQQNQPQDQNKDRNQPQNQDNQPQAGQISPQQAQQMLRAVQAQEKQTQDKVNKKKAEALKSARKEKNW